MYRLMERVRRGSSANGRHGITQEDNATEITIEVGENSLSFYKNAASKFEAETGVKVNVINDYDGSLSDEEYDAARARIQAELMAGKGADIYASIYLDFIGIGQNGHLCNLANWVAQDPYFSDDTFYMNLVGSRFDEGDLYSLLLLMQIETLGSTIEVPELNGKSLDWEEFFELTKGIERSGVLYGITDYRLFTQRFKERYERFVDEENRTQSLNSPEMIQLLEQCKEWGEEGLCIPFTAESTAELYANAFFRAYGGGINKITNISGDSPFFEKIYFYDLPSDTGKNDKANEILTTDFVCINAASQCKGTAWKFVKFLFSEDIQANGYAPVNRKAAAGILSEMIEEFKLDIDPDQAIKETDAILDAIDDLPDIYPNDITQIVLKEAERFFSNEISAEEAAKNMEAGVALYFKEQ